MFILVFGIMLPVWTCPVKTMFPCLILDTVNLRQMLLLFIRVCGGVSCRLTFSYICGHVGIAFMVSARGAHSSCNEEVARLDFTKYKHSFSQTS